MKTVKTSRAILVCLLGSFVLLAGCTNWQKEYNALNVEHENVKGLLEDCRSRMDSSGSEKSVLASQLAAKQQTIDQLQKQLADMQRMPSGDTGFGGRYQVDVDSSAGTITVTLPNTILFDSGKATLKKGSYRELDDIVGVLKRRYSGKNIEVIGHTDSDPIKKSKWKDNWELSVERALSVVRYLESHGISGRRLTANGRGPTMPVASNATSSGKAKNRRVELVIKMR